MLLIENAPILGAFMVLLYVGLMTLCAVLTWRRLSAEQLDEERGFDPSNGGVRD